MNEYVVIGLGLGIISIVMIAVFLLCHRKRKRRRLEHPSNSLEHSSEFTVIWLRLTILIFLSWNKKILPYSSCWKTLFFISFLVLPSHAHFHTCESIGERFATSSSINSVSHQNTNKLDSFSISYDFTLYWNHFYIETIAGTFQVWPNNKDTEEDEQEYYTGRRP